MKCPHCNKEIPDKLLRKEAAKALGSSGGKTTGKSKARSSEQARRAVLERWKRYREQKKQK